MSNWTMSLVPGDKVMLRWWGAPKDAAFEAEVVRVGKQQIAVQWQDGARTREAKYMRSSGQPYGYDTNATLLRKAE